MTGPQTPKTKTKTHKPMFTSEDLLQIQQHGLTTEAVEQQLENFRRGFPFLKVVRAASPGDGVRVLSREEAQAAAER